MFNVSIIHVIFQNLRKGKIFSDSTLASGNFLICSEYYLPISETETT